MIRYRILSFLRYFLSARNAHGIQSPFIYDLYTQVIHSKRHFYAFDEIEKYRQSLRHDHQELQLIELGAGFATGKSTSIVKVKDLYKSSCHSRKDTSLLFRLVHHFNPQIILELGTCLGLSTLYIAKASTKAKVYTFEGNHDYVSQATKAFHHYRCPNVEIVEGNIHQTLQAVIADIPTLDFAFLDAHHAYEPTLSFFRTCLTKTHEQSVIVLDDIHWSPEMGRAWETIKSMKEVYQTIDLYQFGLVFFRSTQAREHFVLRYF